MLIRAVRAENFMRFARLEITDLPTRGIIGIEGPNESGKSTIGEVLLFAFFGKTRLSAESALTSLIRWSADSMSAEVEFSIRPAPFGEAGGSEATGDFLIFRQIDRYGTNYVKVLELPARREAAAGNRQVAEFIAKNVKFGFHEIQHSFYHDQHTERRAQTSQTAFFECAAGMKHLRLAMEDLRKEAEPMQREFGYFQREIARNLGQIEKYDKNVVKIPDLAARAAKLVDSIAEQSKKAAELKRRGDGLRADAAGLEARAKRIEQLPEASVEAFSSQVEKLFGGDDAASRAGTEIVRAFATEARELVRLVKNEREAVERRIDPSTDGGPATERARLEAEAEKLGRRANWALINAIPAMVVGAGTAFIAYSGFQFGIQAPGFWPESWKATIHWQVAAFAFFTLLFAFLRLRQSSARRWKKREVLQSWAELDTQIAALHKAADDLAPLAAVDHAKDLPHFTAQAAACCSEPVAQVASRIRSKYGALAGEGDSKGLEKAIASLAKADRDQRSRLLSEAQRLEKSSQEEDAAAKRLAGEKERADSEIRECQSQAAKKEVLEAKNKELQASAAVARDGMDLKLLACRLLEDSIASIRSRIGPSLTRFVKSVLPRLTAGRYRDVRVENDLQIKVFSSEKSDFLSLHELSGGTSEALCLALRLAVSHAFTAARARQSQFVFLDEPFKMMDGTRAAETLRILPRLSPGLEQFFVAQPSFSSEGRELLDVLIRTSPGTAVLETRGSSPRERLERDTSPAADLARIEGQDPSPHVVEA